MISVKNSVASGVIRPISIFLIILLLYSGAGFILTFEIELANLRTAVQEMLQSEEKGSLVTLKFHRSANIHFKDEGKEIYLEGQMYDILKQEQRGDSIIFVCFHDVEESKQLHNFSNQVQDFAEGTTSDQEKDFSIAKEKQEYIQPYSIRLPFLLVATTMQSQGLSNALAPALVPVPYPPPEVL